MKKHHLRIIVSLNPIILNMVKQTEHRSSPPPDIQKGSIPIKHIFNTPSDKSVMDQKVLGIKYPGKRGYIQYLGKQFSRRSRKK